MTFVSDGSSVRKGFKFDILCQGSSKKGQVAASECNYFDDNGLILCDDNKNVIIANEDDLENSFEKEISCLTLSDDIQYRDGV